MSDYTVDREFLDLYFEFSGAHDPDFPVGKTALGPMLAQAEIAAAHRPGPLVLVWKSGLYVYDGHSRRLLAQADFRASRSSGFFEITAVSHLGPAVAYMARIKERGDSRWKESRESLLQRLRSVRALNRVQHNHWLDRLDTPAWAAHKTRIRDMVDYACAKAGHYLCSVGDDLSLESVQRDLWMGRAEPFLIGFDAVMIGTFMADALQSVYAPYLALRDVDIDWDNAMVILRSEAGANYSAGLTAQTNWWHAALLALSKGRLPADRIVLAPYAEHRASIGQPVLPEEDFAYLTVGVWGQLFYRTLIATSVMTLVPNLEIPAPPPLPGDYSLTRSTDLDHFMVRLKHSLGDRREMLSNTVAFWLVGELAAKNWDPAAVELPGLTTENYPPSSPEIPD